jgi:hypothetical protein
VPASLKLQQQYGDDLQVIFAECQNFDNGDAVEAAAWRMKFMGTNAMWTEEPPLPIKGDGLPACALIGIDGKLLLEGNPLGLKKQIEENIATQVKLAKSGPADASGDAKKAWAAFAKGDYAGALALAAKLPADEAKKVSGELSARMGSRIARAKWSVDNGYVAEGKKQLGDLQAQVKTDAELSKQVADQLARLSEPALAKEAEASTALSNLTEKMVKDKPFDAGNVKKLEALATKFAGTKAAERASHLVALSKIKQS